MDENYHYIYFPDKRMKKYVKYIRDYGQDQLVYMDNNGRVIKKTTKSRGDYVPFDAGGLTWDGNPDSGYR